VGQSYIDPLPEMTCNDTTGAITGTSETGYAIAQIGDQVWLAENLKEDLVNIQSQQGWPAGLQDTLMEIRNSLWREADLRSWLTQNLASWLAAHNITNVTSIPIRVINGCYNNDCTNYGKYGRLYDWATAMFIDQTYNREFYNLPATNYERGPCPKGFYLPHDEDWQKLVDYAGGATIAGGRLKSSNKSDWNNNGNGIDAYGFNAKPGGYYSEIKAAENQSHYYEKDSRAMWWSITDVAGGANAYYWTAISSDTEIRNFQQDKLWHKAYVRCLLYLQKE